MTLYIGVAAARTALRDGANRCDGSARMFRATFTSKSWERRPRDGLSDSLQMPGLYTGDWESAPVGSLEDCCIPFVPEMSAA